MSVSAPSIPLGDASDFDHRARTVSRVRAGLAAALLGAALLCLAAAWRLPSTTTSLLPGTSTSIVVLDVSASISSDTYARIATTLDRLIASNGAYGLILFSDTAYQALPPGTPAPELRPVARFFDVRPQESPGALPEAPPSPWTDSFGAGTRISTGLSLALDVIRSRRVVRPAVLLVSDLDDDTGDLVQLSRVAIAYRRAGIPLHVVGLNASPADVTFMRHLIPGNGSFTPAALPSERSGSTAGASDSLLVVAAILLAFALGSFLLTSEPLRWSTP